MQIENEYQNVERAFHERGPPYVRWAAKMAVGLQTGVPWNMCKQDDAPDPVVSQLHLQYLATVPIAPKMVTTLEVEQDNSSSKLLPSYLLQDFSTPIFFFSAWFST